MKYLHIELLMSFDIIYQVRTNMIFTEEDIALQGSVLSSAETLLQLTDKTLHRFQIKLKVEKISLKCKYFL